MTREQIEGGPGFDLAARDALGLTERQRAEGEMLTLTGDFLDRIRAGLAALDSLPAGVMIMCSACGEPHPVEVFR